jgi:hypothetical protein
MFEQTSRLAERVAASVSRRGFLGSLGGWAVAAAMGIGGMLSVSSAWAGGKECTGKCCVYTCGALITVDRCNQCPSSVSNPSGPCPFQACGPNRVGGDGLCICHEGSW